MQMCKKEIAELHNFIHSGVLTCLPPCTARATRCLPRGPARWASRVAPCPREAGARRLRRTLQPPAGARSLVHPGNHNNIAWHRYKYFHDYYLLNFYGLVFFIIYNQLVLRHRPPPETSDHLGSVKCSPGWSCYLLSSHYFLGLPFICLPYHWYKCIRSLVQFSLLSLITNDAISNDKLLQCAPCTLWDVESCTSSRFPCADYLSRNYK